MEAEIRSTYPDAKITMLPSSGGRFEVTHDGKTIFSKKALGRHAAPGEILRLLAGAGS